MTLVPQPAAHQRRLPARKGVWIGHPDGDCINAREVWWVDGWQRKPLACSQCGIDLLVTR